MGAHRASESSLGSGEGKRCAKRKEMIRHFMKPGALVSRKRGIVQWFRGEMLCRVSVPQCKGQAIFHAFTLQPQHIIADPLELGLSFGKPLGWRWLTGAKLVRV